MKKVISLSLVVLASSVFFNEVEGFRVAPAPTPAPVAPTSAPVTSTPAPAAQQQFQLNVGGLTAAYDQQGAQVVITGLERNLTTATDDLNAIDGLDYDGRGHLVSGITGKNDVKGRTTEAFALMRQAVADEKAKADAAGIALGNVAGVTSLKTVSQDGDYFHADLKEAAKIAVAEGKMLELFEPSKELADALVAVGKRDADALVTALKAVEPVTKVTYTTAKTDNDDILGDVFEQTADVIAAFVKNSAGVAANWTGTLDNGDVLAAFVDALVTK